MKLFVRSLLILCSVLLLIFLIFICIIITDKKNSKQTYIGNFTSFIVVGESMEPTLKANDLIILKKGDSYKNGDIITFKNEEGYKTTHRIIKIESDGYVTQGDNNKFTDGYHVPKENVYGKVVYTIKNANSILKFVFTYKYIIIAVIFIIPVVIYLLSKRLKCTQM